MFYKIPAKCFHLDRNIRFITTFFLVLEEHTRIVKMRVQSDHWAIILEFCEQHPQIITNKFKGLGGRNELAELWKKLTIKLNALGFGEKTVEAWKKTIINWKSKTKAKAGTIKTHITKTGGGSQCHLVLTSYEERLLTIMGKTAYEGNPENMKRGIRKRKLFDEEHNNIETIDTEPEVPLYSTTEYVDHTYSIQNTLAEQEIIIDHELPVANETLISIDKVRSGLSKIQPTVHTNIPSFSSAHHVFSLSNINNSSRLNSLDLSNIEIPSTSLSKDIPSVHLSYIPSSTSQFTPSKININNQISKTNIPSVHLASESNTPCKSNMSNPFVHDVGEKKNSARKRTGYKKDGTEQLAGMHKELLTELKNINVNINSIAESLKLIATSIKK